MIKSGLMGVICLLALKLSAPAYGTELVSANKEGTDAGILPSTVQSISADGRLIAFTSDASDLVTFPLDNNQTTDVFVRDTQTGTTTMLSVNKLGSNSANGRSAHPVISQNGARVAFTSWANDVTTTPDANNASDIFLRDIASGATTHISVNRLGTAAGNGGSDGAVL